MFKAIKNKRGQSVVELAILLPVLLLLLMGIFEFGRIMNAQLVISHASREGVRVASVGGNDEEIIGRVNVALGNLDLSKASISISPISTNRTRGSSVTVKISYDIDVLVPIIEEIIPDPYRLNSETSMRIE